MLKHLLPALALASLAFSQEPDPWSKAELLQPGPFAARLQSPGADKPHIICVAFPVLFRSKHIAGAKFAGPGAREEGIADLKKAVAGIPKDSEIVLYCGCCPMEKCPNLRPAFRTLKQLGYTKVRALNIPTNMHTDWYTKNYPSEVGPAGAETPLR
jgi:hypothetical protein